MKMYICSDPLQKIRFVSVICWKKCIIPSSKAVCHDTSQTSANVEHHLVVVRTDIHYPREYTTYILHITVVMCKIYVVYLTDCFFFCIT